MEAACNLTSIRLCPCCERLSDTVEVRLRNTAYVDERLNTLESCLECYGFDCDYFSELWSDYFNSRL